MAATYRVRAYNTATASENRIHEDGVARRFGFRGGLVPGVDVYAYLTHPLVARWGRPWLERGTMRVRFLRPVYDGEDVVVTCAPAGEADVALEARNPAGDLCAAADAALPPAAPAVDLAAYPPAPLPAAAPPATPAALAPGAVLGSIESTFHADRAPAYLADVRETLPLYRAAGIAHPGYLLRGANFVLAANVVLGPWIHVGSDVRHLGVVADGDRVAIRARVAAEYEKKGHRFVELDVLFIAAGTRPVLHVRHTAIYALRAELRAAP